MDGFFTKNFAKGFAYWFLPFVVYFGSLFVIAFARESFAALIYITIIMLHPIITIPMSTFVDCIQGKVLGLLKKFSCFYPFLNHKMLQRVFTFTMMNYLGCVMGFQWYLFLMWIDDRRTVITSRDDGAFVTTSFGFKDKPFENCDDKSSEGESNWLLNIMAEINQYDKAWILFGASLFFFAFHFIESVFVSLFPDPIPMTNFLSVTPLRKNQNVDNVSPPILFYVVI